MIWVDVMKLFRYLIEPLFPFFGKTPNIWYNDASYPTKKCEDHFICSRLDMIDLRGRCLGICMKHRVSCDEINRKVDDDHSSSLIYKKKNAIKVTAFV